MPHGGGWDSAGMGCAEEGVKRAGRKSLGRAGRTGPALRTGWSRPGGEGKKVGHRREWGGLGSLVWAGFLFFSNSIYSLFSISNSNKV